METVLKANYSLDNKNWPQVLEFNIDITHLLKRQQLPGWHSPFMFLVQLPVTVVSD